MPRKKKKSKKPARLLVSIIVIIALFILFFSFGPGKMFFMSVTNPDNFSSTFMEDIGVIFQTLGLLALMCGFPVIAVIIILGICTAGKAVSHAVIPDDDEEEEDDSDKDTTA